MFWIGINLAAKPAIKALREKKKKRLDDER
jgi:hypothetical protein